MKKKTFDSLALGVVLVLAAFSVACKNGSSSFSLDEYFQKLEDISNNNYSAYATQEAALITPSNSASGEELAAFQRDSWTITGAAQRNYARQIGDLDTPAAASDARDNLVAALNDAANALDNAAAAIPASITSLQDAGSYYNSEELTAKLRRLPAVCHALQQIAADNDITVDLGCE